MKEVLEYLMRDIIINVDIINTINENRHIILSSNKEGVVIKDKNTDIIMISSTSLESSRELIKAIPKEAEIIIGHQEFYYDHLKEIMKPKQEMHCYTAVYRGSKEYELNSREITIKRLNEEYEGFVIKHYSNEACNEDYIKGRVREGAVFGAFIEGELTGFIGTHEEGSIGMLEVLPSYRQRGIATELQKYLTNKALRAGIIPYGEVVLGNENSIGLQKKLGYEISTEKVYWLFK